MTSNQSSPENTAESIAPAALDSAQLATTDAPFPIVGIAASAGGLEAFTELLSHLPVDTGMAFVLIQHLAPYHKSLLTEILARQTQMPVSEVKDGVAVEPNQVYVIPPNTKMVLCKGVLQLSPPRRFMANICREMRFLPHWRSIADTKPSP
jgi:two-component system CheB/CheR fusion protein